MRESLTPWIETLELHDRPQPVMVDFNHIQVAPQNAHEPRGFYALSLAERQILLQRLIERVKSL